MVETYLLGLKFSKNLVDMGNFRTDVSGLAKLQVKERGTYFGNNESVLMIDEISLFECKQVVHKTFLKLPSLPNFLHPTYLSLFCWLYLFALISLLMTSGSLTISEDMKMSFSNLMWLKYYSICVIFFIFKLPKELFQGGGENFQRDTKSIFSYTSMQFLHTSCHAKLKYN